MILVFERLRTVASGPFLFLHHVGHEEHEDLEHEAPQPFLEKLCVKTIVLHNSFFMSFLLFMVK